VSEVTRTTGDIVQKLWSLCHILRDDGITYNEYVTELTFLLFLKMMQETGRDNRLPNSYCWSSLAQKEGEEQLRYYQQLLLDLATPRKQATRPSWRFSRTRRPSCASLRISRR
jgi:type I restriction enzyme M protein